MHSCAATLRIAHTNTHTAPWIRCLRLQGPNDREPSTADMFFRCTRTTRTTTKTARLMICRSKRSPWLLLMLLLAVADGGAYECGAYNMLCRPLRIMSIRETAIPTRASQSASQPGRQQQRQPASSTAVRRQARAIVVSARVSHWAIYCVCCTVRYSTRPSARSRQYCAKRSVRISHGVGAQTTTVTASAETAASHNHSNQCNSSSSKGQERHRAIQVTYAQNATKTLGGCRTQRRDGWLVASVCVYVASFSTVVVVVARVWVHCCFSDAPRICTHWGQAQAAHALCRTHKSERNSKSILSIYIYTHVRVQNTRSARVRARMCFRHTGSLML